MACIWTTHATARQSWPAYASSTQPPKTKWVCTLPIWDNRAVALCDCLQFSSYAAYLHVYCVMRLCCLGTWAGSLGLLSLERRLANLPALGCASGAEAAGSLLRPNMPIKLDLGLLLSESACSSGRGGDGNASSAWCISYHKKAAQHATWAMCATWLILRLSSSANNRR